MDTILKIKGLKKSFGSNEVLRGIDYNVNKGSVISVIGPSGGGKSTFLRCINLIEHPSQGSILVNDKDITKKENQNLIYKEIGMVFQSFNLFPHMTVLKNITLAPDLKNIASKKENIDYAKYLLDKVGLSDKMDKKPQSLSGGQKQRVAIVRALAMRPEIMLFDEPTSALDPEMVGEVLQVIESLKDEKMTMIIVTHLMGFAKEVGDRTVFIEGGLIGGEDNSKAFFTEPSNQRIKDFLNKIL